MPEMIRHWRDEQGTLLVAAAGRWIIEEAQALDQQLQAIDGHGVKAARIDLAKVEELDTCGAALLLIARDQFAAAGADVQFIGAHEEHMVLLNHIQEWRKKAPDDSVPATSMMERLATLLMGFGARIASLGAEARDFAAFIGLTLARSSSPT